MLDNLGTTTAAWFMGLCKSRGGIIYL